MKIVHIAPCAPYNAGWGYQENILPRYQKKLGHDVILYTTNMEHKNGQLVEVECSDSITCDGFRVVRKKVQKSNHLLLKSRISKIDVYSDLVRETPDFIFYHGLVDATIFQVARYKRENNPNCIIVQDNHNDQNNGFDPRSFSGFVKKCIYTHIFRKNKRYISCVYGVTPGRMEYAHNAFGVPYSMLDVLIMGADDEELNSSVLSNARQRIRAQYCVEDDDFLVVSGGRIDKKKNIHILMRAINQLSDSNIKMLVFGNVHDDVKSEFEKELSDRVKWVGFIPSKEAYDYFLASDLVFFPGLHSVLWEQACASKVPCVFSNIAGLEHLNNGGNALFIDDLSEKGMTDMLVSLNRTPQYIEMLGVAKSSNTDIYRYSKIAEKSLEIGRGDK